jgi:hypothetical protein
VKKLHNNLSYVTHTFRHNSTFLVSLITLRWLHGLNRNDHVLHYYKVYSLSRHHWLLCYGDGCLVYGEQSGNKQFSLYNGAQSTSQAMHFPNAGRSCFTPGLHSWKMLCKSKLCKSNTKFPSKTVYFLGVRGLTTSSI